MKRLLIITFGLFLSVGLICALEESSITVWKALKLGYPAKTLKKTVFGGQIKTRLEAKATKRFNIQLTVFETDGSVKDAVTLYSDGTLIGRTKYTVDAEARTVVAEDMDPFSGRSDLKQTFIYNESGQLIQKDTILGSFSSTTYFYAYDSAGNLASCVGKRYNGEIVSDVSYSIDSVGRITSAVTKSSDGETRSVSRYIYDEAGNNIEIDGYNASGTMMSRRLYEYDARGNITVERHQDFSDPSMKPEDCTFIDSISEYEYFSESA